MAGNERFDDTIARWLEEAAPDRLPQRVLAATFERTGRTRQESAWRTLLGRPKMPRLVPVIPAIGGVAVVVAATVVALNLGLIASPGATTSPSASATALPSAPSSPSATSLPTPPPLASRFTSAIHGISVEYPAGWQTRPATQATTGGEVDFNTPDADVIFEPTLGDRLYVLMASQPLPGEGEEFWPLVIPGQLCGTAGRNEPAGSIDGFQAFARTCGRGEIVRVSTDTREYLIALLIPSDAPPGIHRSYDWAWFRSVLDTVDLRPEDAVDAP